MLAAAVWKQQERELFFIQKTTTTNQQCKRPIGKPSGHRLVKRKGWCVNDDFHLYLQFMVKLNHQQASKQAQQG